MQSSDMREQQDRQLLKLLEDNPAGITFQYAFKQIDTLEDSISLSSCIGRLTKQKLCFKQNGLYFKVGEELAGEYVPVSAPVKETITKTEEVDTAEIQRLMSIVTGIKPKSDPEPVQEEEEKVEDKPRISMVRQMLTQRTFVKSIGTSSPVTDEAVDTQVNKSPTVKEKSSVNSKNGTFRRNAATGYLAFLLYKFDGNNGLTYEEIFEVLLPLKITKTAIHQAMFKLNELKMVTKRDGRFHWSNNYSYPFSIRAESDMTFMRKEITAISNMRNSAEPAQEITIEQVVVAPVVEKSIPEETVSNAEYFESFLDVKAFLKKEIDAVKQQLARLEEAYGKL